ncbi:MAG: GNAT family N-acetyltransferase [Bacillota bacterium]|nr:GNAT family N-acetyltransferase [Bacillota bacterium]
MSEIVIRDVRMEDVGALLDIYSYYVENTVITFEYEVPSVEEFSNRIRNITETYPYIVLEEDGILQGYAYAGVFKGRAAYDWACEMTIYLDHRAQKKGFGKKLYGALEERLISMGMKNLYACIGYPEVEDEYLTKNSAHFHEHLGYTLCGRFRRCGYKFNRWYDMIWMEKIVGEHETNTHPIQKYKEL